MVRFLVLLFGKIKHEKRTATLVALTHQQRIGGSGVFKWLINVEQHSTTRAMSTKLCNISNFVACSCDVNGPSVK